MKLVAAGFVALSLPFAFASGVDASAEPDASNPTISVAVDGPPADRDALDIALTLDGVDITEQACETILVDGLPELECADLELGTYALELTDSRDDGDVEAFCSDLVANIIDPATIPVAERVGDVDCFVQLAGPSILFTAVDDDPFDPVLLDSDDNAVVCTDELRTIDGASGSLVEQRRWCPTPAGTYRIDRDSIDPLFIDVFFCDGWVGPRNDFETPTDPFESIEITDDISWLICSQGSFGPASFYIDWNGPVDDPATWFDALELTLRDDEGDITECVRVNEFSVPGNKAVQFDCDVSAGVFTPALTGVPAGTVAITVDVESVDPATLCGEFDTRGNGEGRCAVSLTTPNAPTPDVDVELPATGRTTAPLLALGFGLLLLGLGLLAGSRRRLI